VARGSRLAIAFTIGALLPMATILLVPHPTRILATFVAVLLALAVTGYVAAWIGGRAAGAQSCAS
jgi:VIT1/CCC1 family predicted Fe2+/Mn2+ transporter